MYKQKKINQDKESRKQKKPNAGSGNFNQGSEQDPDFDKGVQVSDEEKETGDPPSPLSKKKKGTPVDKNK